MSLRIPSPKALTKPEAYLAYKAGILSRDELKQSVYNPLNNYEGWLAKWCGLLETYPTNKDGTPQCLTDEEGLLAYLCGVTDRYPASNSRPDDARISAYIRYLVSARYVRPDHPLNREEFYLSLIKTQFIPSGDPSSDIVIDGTAKAPFVDVKMYGDTFQQTYTGKNLYKWGNVTFSSDVTSSSWCFQDGSTGAYGANITSKTTYKLTLPAGTYYLSAYDVSSNIDRINLCADGDSAERVIASPNGSFNLSEETVVVIRYRVTNPSLGIGNTKLQLESGSTATDYEPYVGGQASPNPDYPQAIQTVTGEQTVTVVGKNLFNKVNYLDDTFINASTGAVGSGKGFITIYAQVSPSSEFTISKLSTSRFIVAESANIPEVGDTVTVLSGIAQTSEVKTVTTSASASYLAIMVKSSSDTLTVQQILNSIQIEAGSTATSYVPYTEQSYPIDLGNIELCGLGDDGNGNPLYKDRIYRDGEEWKIHKAIGKYVYGDDLAQNGISETMVSMITPTLPVIRNLAHDSGICQSNMYTPIDQNGTGLSGTTGTNRIRIYTAISIANSYNAVRQLASANNLTIYYPLNTATDTVITDQTLIAQLEALVKGGSEDGTTYIKVSATDPNLPAKLYVEAPKYD